MSHATRNAAGDASTTFARPFALATSVTCESSFDAFADALRDDLAPQGVLEKLLADRLILAAWRLRLDAERQTEVVHRGLKPVADSPAVQKNEKSLKSAVDLLEEARGLRPYRWGVAAETDSKSSTPPLRLDEIEDAPAFDETFYFSNEWTTLPDALDFEDLAEDAFDFDDEVEAEDESDDAPADRLAFDFNVSDASPVVKGTALTAGYVVSLIVDGWLWSEVIDAHPELTEDDVRACLAYVVEQDDQGR